MGIINVTPDSFATAPSEFGASLQEAQAQIEAGVDILDIGGMSTAPHAADVSPEDELARLVPFIKAVRQTIWGKSITISVDTFRAKVARQCIEAGATWINDVKAGANPQDEKGAMWKVAKESGTPIILMHSRGDAKTMNTLAEYSSDPIQDIVREMTERVSEALEYGVKPWQIIVDPGFGFAKNAETNWTLLSRLEEFIQSRELQAYPCLIGTSRKRFLGSLTGKDPAERDGATAATCVEAVRQGAHIVRVHNPAAVIDALKVADRLYR